METSAAACPFVELKPYMDLPPIGEYAILVGKLSNTNTLEWLPGCADLMATNSE